MPVHSPSRARTLVLCGLATAAATLVTSCATLTSGAPSASQGAPAPVSTAVPRGEVTLTIVTSENTGTTRALAEAFHAGHPNVTVDLRYTPPEEYDENINRELSSDDAPDLALLNKLGTTVKDGLIRSLDGYADVYGWESTYPSGQLDQWRSSPDGAELRFGPLWAAPAGFSMVGVYYNKATAARLGIEVPADLAAFDAALAKAKAAGEVPVQLGNLQGHSSFVLQSIVDAQDGARETGNWVRGRPGSTLRTHGGREAARTLSHWADNGYFPDDANSKDLPAAVADFTRGQGLFLFDGSWDGHVIDRTMPGDAGFFLFPGDMGNTTAIGTSLAYAIPTRSDEPDLAAAFLDFMNSPEAAAIQYSTGFLPVAHTDSVKAPAGHVMGDITRGWAAVNEHDGLVNFFANSTPTMSTTLTSQSRRLIDREITPDDYLAALQNDWAGGHWG
ncbi:ABC transporter substrate-binding protein [Streptomyces globisporus]|uniref:ABC transporter substrate-binding protein n=1 Tax=Streptomyces globisporus TaxID=1908 RepID=UPI0004C4C65E|nr:extracellular solute-binding protein [Streptomyces globisporus]